MSSLDGFAKSLILLFRARFWDPESRNVIRKITFLRVHQPILITGGLGFIGTQLSIRFIEKGHSVTVVGKDPHRMAHTPNEVEYIAADTTTKGTWQEEIAHKDAVINLAGTSIFTRWNDKTKKLIHDSRILTTQNVVEAMVKGNNTILC
ncbi:MAG: NAD-dependent epimerase/dehydratase family protein, partial [Deltaproteobacteria bacterium]|nr:NAD-dependent epimerase/dehydratase family protein [Deltaproteobacteria bacterium]